MQTSTLLIVLFTIFSLLSVASSSSSSSSSSIPSSSAISSAISSSAIPSSSSTPAPTSTPLVSSSSSSASALTGTSIYKPSSSSAATANGGGGGGGGVTSNSTGATPIPSSSSSTGVLVQYTAPAGSVVVLFLIQVTTIPAGPFNSSSPFVVNLENDIATALAAQTNTSYNIIRPLVIITNLNGTTVYQIPTSRRLLQLPTNNLTVNFVIAPPASSSITFNPTTAANTFATAAAAGQVSLPSTPGATVPPQALPIVQVVYASSTGVGTGAASAQASAIMALFAVIASVALFL